MRTRGGRDKSLDMSQSENPSVVLRTLVSNLICIMQGKGREGTHKYRILVFEAWCLSVIYKSEKRGDQ